MTRVRSTVDQQGSPGSHVTSYSGAGGSRISIARCRRTAWCQSFVTGEYWAFAGSRTAPAPPLGFDRVAAELGIRLNGFHLFEIVRRCCVCDAEASCPQGAKVAVRQQ